MQTKLEAALLITPFDLVSALVAFGTEQAFQWLGKRPCEEAEFYQELGRKISQMTMKAWEEQLQTRPEDRWD